MDIRPVSSIPSYDKDAWLRDIIFKPFFRIEPPMHLQHLWQPFQRNVVLEDAARLYATISMLWNRKAAGLAEEGIVKSATGMQLCAPAGIVIQSHERFGTCKFRICPWCTARRLGSVYDDFSGLSDSILRRKDASSVTCMKMRLRIVNPDLTVVDQHLAWIKEVMAKLAKQCGGALKIIQVLPVRPGRKCSDWTWAISGMILFGAESEVAAREVASQLAGARVELMPGGHTLGEARKLLAWGYNYSPDLLLAPNDVMVPYLKYMKGKNEIAWHLEWKEAALSGGENEAGVVDEDPEGTLIPQEYEVPEEPAVSETHASVGNPESLDEIQDKLLEMIQQMFSSSGSR